MRRIRPPRLYAIADWDVVSRHHVGHDQVTSYCEVVRDLIAEGAGWIQVRAKTMSGARHFDLVQRVLEEVGERCGVWVDDRADLAALLPVTGVHLGQKDLPTRSARELLGAHCLIGLSTHDLDQVKAAERDDDVDVVAFGPIFATRSKADPDPRVGIELLSAARSLTTKPLVAIGGIDSRNAPSVLAAGADTVAAIVGFCVPPNHNSGRWARLGEI